MIHNIQDVQYGSRHYFVDILTPDFSHYCAAVEIPHTRIDVMSDMKSALESAMNVDGPVVLEINMEAIGPFARAFAGPPARVPVEEKVKA